MAGSQFGEIPRRQHRHVLDPLPQRDRTDCDDVEPVEKVLAEPTLLNLRRQITIGRSEHTDVDGQFLMASDWHYDPLLQHP